MSDLSEDIKERSMAVGSGLVAGVGATEVAGGRGGQLTSSLVSQADPVDSMGIIKILGKILWLIYLPVEVSLTQ